MPLPTASIACCSCSTRRSSRGSRLSTAERCHVPVATPVRADETGRTAMTLLLRLVLAVLFTTELVVGAWNQFAPESFYEDFPTVDLTPPFSEHYARDFGGATLGLALLLGIALVVPRFEFALPALLAFEIYAIPHLVFHLGHLEHATSAQAVGLTTSNAAVALVGLVGIALVLLRRARRGKSAATTRQSRSGSAVTDLAARTFSTISR